MENNKSFRLCIDGLIFKPGDVLHIERPKPQGKEVKSWQQALVSYNAQWKVPEAYRVSGIGAAALERYIPFIGDERQNYYELLQDNTGEIFINYGYLQRTKIHLHELLLFPVKDAVFSMPVESKFSLLDIKGDLQQHDYHVGDVLYWFFPDVQLIVDVVCDETLLNSKFFSFRFDERYKTYTPFLLGKR